MERTHQTRRKNSVRRGGAGQERPLAEKISSDEEWGSGGEGAYQVYVTESPWFS